MAAGEIGAATGVKAALTTQLALNGAVMKGLVVDALPQLLSAGENPAKVNPALAVAEHVDVVPAATGEVQVAVPPAGGLTFVVTVYSGENEPVTVQLSKTGDEVMYGDVPDGPPHPLVPKAPKM